MNYGKKVWIFPDAELPPVGANLIPGHESVIITNVTDEEATVKFTLLYTIVAQYGRAEPRAVNFYTTPGYCE